LLGSADYTASNGTTVVLATGASAGNLVTVESFQISSVANAIPNAVGAVTSSNIQSGVTLTAPNLGTPASGVMTNVTGLPAAQLTGSQAIPKATLPTGSVLQVVYGSTTTPTTGVGTSYTSMGLSATITPTSATNKVLVMAVAYSGDTSAYAVWFQLYKNGSAISGTTATQYHGAPGNPNYACAPTNINYLDSPATTSATTYAVFGRADNSTVTLGGPVLNSYGQGTALQLNSIVLMEVAA
jgi:hypothetical protein